MKTTETLHQWREAWLKVLKYLELVKDCLFLLLYDIKNYEDLVDGGYRIRRPNPNCSIIDQSYYHQADAKSLFLNSSFTTFFQILTSVLPTPIAVTSMPRATILWDHTHARAKQDTQEMEEHALVSRFELFKRKEIMFLIPESWFTRVQKKRVFGRSDNNNRTNNHYHFTIANLVE